MELDTVESGGYGIGRRATILLDDFWNLRCLECARHVVFLHPGGVGVDLAAGANRRWGHGLRTGGPVMGRTDPAAMHELHHDAATLGVHRIGHPPPGSDLRIVVNSWRPAITDSVR